MALNWNVENVRDHEALWIEDDSVGSDGHRLNPKTESLIWFSMVAGLYSEITDESAADWFARISLYERINGEWCYRRNEETGAIEPDPFTPEDIIRNIGLRTNGHYGKKEAWSTFVKRITQSHEADAKRKFGAVAFRVSA